MPRRIPPQLRRRIQALYLGLVALGTASALLGCSEEDKKPSARVHKNGTVGSACSEHASDCNEGGTCLSALTGGAAFSPLVDPLPAPLGYCSSECSGHDDCGEGGVCFGRGLLGGGGECRRACKADDECSEGQECASAGELASPLLPDTCQPNLRPNQLADREAGRHCTRDDACGDGFCAEPGHPDGGYCSGLCLANEHCGSGGKCVRGLYGSSGVCRETCTRDSDCQNDATGWGCGHDGVCVREANPLSNVGAPCTRKTVSEDCGTGSCRTTDLAGVRYPDGYCVGSCDEDDDCGPEGVCINSLTCFLRCDATRDCRAGYECAPHPQALGGDRDTSVCFPKHPE